MNLYKKISFSLTWVIKHVEKTEGMLMKSENEITESTAVDKLLFDVGCLKHLSRECTAVIIFLILWELLPTVGLLNPLFIPPPSTIAIAITGMLISSNEFLMHILISLWRVFIGFGLALLVAIPLGYLLGGYFKNFEKFINPLLTVLGQINPWSVLIVVVAILGFGQISVIAVVFYIALWPVLYNTVTGVKNVDPIFVKIGKAAGLSNFDIFRKVKLPASIPMVFAGMRFAAILAFFMAIGAEMVGADDGLGYYLLFNQMYARMPEMWGCIVTMSLLGIVFVYALLQLEKYFTNWKEDMSENEMN